MSDAKQDPTSPRQATNAPLSFKQQIVPLFNAQDVSCMNPMGVHLTNYTYMSAAAGDGTFPDHANANHVYARLTGAETPRMPRGGTYWSQDELGLFNQWMQGGYQP